MKSSSRLVERLLAEANLCERLASECINEYQAEYMRMLADGCRAAALRELTDLENEPSTPQ